MTEAGGMNGAELEALKTRLRELATEAMAAQTERNLDKAIDAYRRMLELAPGLSEVHSNLGVALFDRGDLDGAVAAFEHAIALKPQSAEAHSNLGYALQEQGRHEEAEEALRRAIALKEDYAEAYSNLGNLLQQQGRADEAVAALHQATAIDPGHAKAHNNLAQVLLRGGDYEAGWREYEWRWHSIGLSPRAYPQPRWDGIPLPGRTILLYAEQGLGDTIQFVRYVRMVAALGMTVILEAPTVLAPLFRQCPATVVESGRALPPFDVHLPLMSLPLVFGTTVATIPADIPYLNPPGDRVAARDLPPAPPGARRIGFAWGGNPDHPNDRNRSLPYGALARLLDRPDIQAFSFQLGRNDGHPDAPMIDLAPRLNDFADTAAWLAGMDLCISADTAFAHLAGAMGKPVWILLPFSPDWRWLRERADSPWYPTARLFRQPAPGDWGSVLAAVERALDQGL